MHFISKIERKLERNFDFEEEIILQK